MNLTYYVLNVLLLNASNNYEFVLYKIDTHYSLNNNFHITINHLIYEKIACFFPSLPTLVLCCVYLSHRGCTVNLLYSKLLWMQRITRFISILTFRYSKNFYFISHLQKNVPIIWKSNNSLGVEELAQCLRALELAEDSSSIPITHVATHDYS